MLRLAIDTSTLQTGLALADESLLELRRFGASLKAGSHLVPAIDRLFLDHKRRLEDLKAIILVIGPGSFTGLRIGLATAKGLALAKDIPLVPVSSLEVLARQAPLGNGTVIPVITARKGEVYHGSWKRDGGNLSRMADPGRCSHANLLADLPDDAFLVGPALAALRPELATLDREVATAAEQDCQISLPWLLELGRIKLQREGAAEPALLEPEYMQAFQPTTGRKRI